MLKTKSTYRTNQERERELGVNLMSLPNNTFQKLFDTHRSRKYSTFLRGISGALWKDTAFLLAYECLSLSTLAVTLLLSCSIPGRSLSQLQHKAKLPRINQELSLDLNSAYFSGPSPYGPPSHPCVLWLNTPARQPLSHFQSPQSMDYCCTVALRTEEKEGR